MSDRKLRSFLRWSHVALGLMLATYLYTPLHSDATATMIARFLLVPMMMITGAMMWQLLSITKFSDKD